MRMTRSPRDDSATTPSKLAGERRPRARDEASPASPTTPGRPAAARAGSVAHARRLDDLRDLVVLVADVPAARRPDSLLAVYEGAAGTPAGALDAGRRQRRRLRDRHGQPSCASARSPVTATSSPIDAKTRGHRSRWASRAHRPTTTATTRPASRAGRRPTTSDGAARPREPGEPSPRRRAGRALRLVSLGRAAQRQRPRRAVRRDVRRRRRRLRRRSRRSPRSRPPAPPRAAAIAGFANIGTGPHFDIAVTGGPDVPRRGRRRAAARPAYTGALTMTIGTPLNDDFADATSLADPTDGDQRDFDGTSAATGAARRAGARRPRGRALVVVALDVDADGLRHALGLRDLPRDRRRHDARGLHRRRASPSCSPSPPPTPAAATAGGAGERDALVLRRRGHDLPDRDRRPRERRSTRA